MEQFTAEQIIDFIRTRAIQYKRSLIDNVSEDTLFQSLYLILKQAELLKKEKEDLQKLIVELEQMVKEKEAKIQSVSFNRYLHDGLGWREKSCRARSH